MGSFKKKLLLLIRLVIRNYVSFTCAVVLCVFCDMLILWKRFRYIRPASMAMQETDAE